MVRRQEYPSLSLEVVDYRSNQCCNSRLRTHKSCIIKNVHTIVHSIIHNEIHRLDGDDAMTSIPITPLFGELPPEVPLPRAPLVRVLTQIKFPTILSIGTSDSEVAAFQEKIRGIYPILEREQSVMIVGSPNAPEVRSGIVWKFRDLKNQWQVALAADFITLEAIQYSSRADFCARLENVLAAVQATYAPSAALRVGVRYVDCIKPPHIDRIEELIQSAVLGIHRTELGKTAAINITECQFKAEEGQIQGRWGLLPPGATHDPGIPLPPEGQSWVLDLDMFSTEQMAFDAAELSNVARSFAGRLYAVFRWMVKDEFLRVFGGTS